MLKTKQNIEEKTMIFFGINKYQTEMTVFKQPLAHFF